MLYLIILIETFCVGQFVSILLHHLRLFAYLHHVADPMDLDDMYVAIHKEGNMPKYLSKRGTSQLEGYHASLRKALPGNHYSTRLSERCTTFFNYK